MTDVVTKFKITASVAGQNAVEALNREIEKTATGGQKLQRAFYQGARLAVGFAAGVATAMGAATAMSLQAINAADNLNDISQRTGVAVEQLAKYKVAAESSGTSIEALGSSWNKLNKNLVDARDGEGAAADALKAMGIQATDATGKLKSADDVTKEIADRFAAFPDGPQKSALAMAVFGKAGAELIPMLNMGSEAISGFSLAIDTEFAQASDAFNDKLGLMRGEAQNLAIATAKTLLPALSDTADIVRTLFGPETQNMASQFGRVTGDVLRVLVVSTATVVAGIKNAITVIEGLGTAAAGVWQMVNGDFEGGKATLAANWNIRTEQLKEHGDELERIIALNVKHSNALGDGGVGAAGSAGGKALPAGVAASMESFSTGADKAAKSAKKAAEEIRKLQEALWERQLSRRADAGAFKALNDYAESAARVADQVGDAITNAFSKAEDALVEFTRTGKLNFRDFASSVIEDLMRMQIRQSITGPLASSLSGLLGNFGNMSSINPAYGFGNSVMWNGPRLAGFATGGSFRVGGSGGTDSQLVAFRASPDERVTIETPGQQRGSMGGVNLAVNVNMTTGEQSSNTTEPDLATLGGMIASGAKSILMNEMRPGGLLYGRAA